MGQPWFGTGRLVCADSWFASFATAAALLDQGLFFIGPVKTGHSRFPKQFFHDPDLFDGKERGAHTVLKTTHQGDPVYGVAWNEPKRKTFVATCGTTVAGVPGQRKRYETVFDQDTGVYLSKSFFKTIPQAKLVETYFTAASAIDEHNGARQGDLGLEDILITQCWWIRGTTTIIGMHVVDTWYAQRYFQPQHKDRALRDFVNELATALIHFDAAPADHLRRREHQDLDADDAARDEVMSHQLKQLITLPKFQALKAKADAKRDGGGGKYRARLTCSVCKSQKNKAAWYCTTCSDFTKNPPKIVAMHNVTAQKADMCLCHQKHKDALKNQQQ